MSVFDRLCLALLGVIVTVLSGLSVAGHGPFAGRTLMTLTYTHGIDQGDLAVVAIWLAAMVTIALLWRRTTNR